MSDTPIKGYTQLTEEQKATMNRIKDMEEQIGKLHQELVAQGIHDPRCLAETKTTLQTAFMWFNRAVAKPKDFFLPEVAA